MNSKKLNYNLTSEFQLLKLSGFTFQSFIFSVISNFLIKGKHYEQQKGFPLQSLTLEYKKISALILFFVSLFFINCSIFSDSVKYPNIAIYENKNNQLYKLTKPNFIMLNKKIRKHHSEIKNFTEENENIFALLNIEQVSILVKSNIEFDKIENPPFKYFDIDYKKRIELGYEDLDSIKSGYKDDVLNEKYLRGLASEYSDKIELHILGKSRLGKNIYAIKIKSISNEEIKSSVLFVGAHHSNELISTEHAYDILYTMLKKYNSYKPLLENLNVWIIPILNPDGSNFFWNQSILMGRKNGYLSPEMKETNLYRGVDLNRNYPFKWNSGNPRASSGKTESVFYRGQSPASEPEVKAIIQLAKKEKFLFSMSFHSNAAAILFPYTIEDTKNPEEDYAKFLGQKLVKFAKSYRTDRNYTLRKNLYPVDGTDQDYLYHEFNTNAFIIESTHQNPEYKVSQKVVIGFRKSWNLMLNEFYEGNKIILKIQNEKLEPIKANISIDEIKTFESEKFTSNKKNGLFIKMFSSPMKINVSVMHKEYKEFKKEFIVSDLIKAETITLEKND